VIADDDGLVRPVSIRDSVAVSGPNWWIEGGPAWLSFDRMSGLAPSEINATADPTGLPPGTHTGSFIVKSDVGDQLVVEAILRVLP